MSEKLKDLIENGGGLTGFDWPDNICDFKMRIGRDGTWYYQDSPIERLKLCQLFATVLQIDDAGEYWLVTPGEKGKITVDDAPFTAVEMKINMKDNIQQLSFRTNLDHWVIADANHPIYLQIKDETGEPSPYIMIRDNLKALITRSVFYDLVNHANMKKSNGRDCLYINSGGTSFKLGEV